MVKVGACDMILVINGEKDNFLDENENIFSVRIENESKNFYSFFSFDDRAVSLSMLCVAYDC